MLFRSASNFFQITSSGVNNVPQALVSLAGVQTGVSANTPLSPNTWNHFALTWNASTTTLSFYINGVLQTGGFSGTAGSGALDLLTIGRRSDGVAASYLSGTIDDFRKYTRVLSQDELQTIHASEGSDGILNSLSNRYMFMERAPTQKPSPFRASTTNTVGTATSITVSVPTVVSGDLMLAAICPGGTSGTPPVINTPAGWTLANSGQTGLPSTGSTPSVYIFYRTAGSEPASYNFTCNQNCTILGTILTYDGARIATSPAIVSPINTGTSASPTAPIISPLEKCLIVQVCAMDGEEVPTPSSGLDRKSTRLNSSHRCISYAVFCLKKKNKK